jgi:hypothetical protein
VEEQVKKTVHITWREAQRAEADRDKEIQARCQPIPPPQSMRELITAHLSANLAKLKTTALRLWNINNKPPRKLQNKRKRSRATLSVERGKYPKTRRKRGPDVEPFEHQEPTRDGYQGRLTGIKIYSGEGFSLRQLARKITDRVYSSPSPIEFDVRKRNRWI